MLSCFGRVLLVSQLSRQQKSASVKREVFFEQCRDVCLALSLSRANKGRLSPDGALVVRVLGTAVPLKEQLLPPPERWNNRRLNGPE